MHFKNGREAKLGDQVIGRISGNVIAGTIVALFPAATSCNVTVRTASAHPLSPGLPTFYGNPMISVDADGKTHQVNDSNPCCNVADLLHAEDALAEVEKAMAAAVPAQAAS
ncbi:MAG: hypothetical protein P4N60_19225 [Verrucomicrobiae bacterium]|nr:hypothetical protein [Verrucomicrobiae bacterium]